MHPHPGYPKPARVTHTPPHRSVRRQRRPARQALPRHQARTHPSSSQRSPRRKQHVRGRTHEEPLPRIAATGWQGPHRERARRRLCARARASTQPRSGPQRTTGAAAASCRIPAPQGIAEADSRQHSPLLHLRVRQPASQHTARPVDRGWAGGGCTCRTISSPPRRKPRVDGLHPKRNCK